MYDVKKGRDAQLLNCPVINLLYVILVEYRLPSFAKYVLNKLKPLLLGVALFRYATLNLRGVILHFGNVLTNLQRAYMERVLGCQIVPFDQNVHHQ